MFVYVTGPYEATTDGIKKRNREVLELVCRRVLLAKHIPICPILFYGEWKKDPRLYSNDGWWVDNIYKALMRLCSVFCIVTSHAEFNSERIRMEKDTWREIGDGKFVVDTRILEHLLGLEDISGQRDND
jgi:hypothetical protein